MKDELIKYVMEKADQCFADDFPIDNIRVWISEFWESYDCKYVDVPKEDKPFYNIEGSGKVYIKTSDKGPYL